MFFLKRAACPGGMHCGALNRMLGCSFLMHYFTVPELCKPQDSPREMDPDEEVVLPGDCFPKKCLRFQLINPGDT